MVITSLEVVTILIQIFVGHKCSDSFDCHYYPWSAWWLLYLPWNSSQPCAMRTAKRLWGWQVFH